MSRTISRAAASLVVLWALVVMVGGWQGPLYGLSPAQDPPVTQDEQPQRKKPRGRLPAYYGKVVTATQREEIYAVQAKYEEQIETLQQQVEELEMQRDMEVEAVLTDEQRQQVAQMREEARSRRAKSGSSGNSTDADGDDG